MINIKIDKLHFTGSTLAENVFLQINAGDKIVISGQTGCGKSSFLKTLNLFNQNYTGIIEYLGKAVKDHSPCRLRSEIIYLMQEPYLPEGKVKDILPEPFSYHCSKHHDFDEQKVTQLLAEFRLAPELLEKPVKQLSGGEKQRLSLLQAILLKPKILLLDEPSSALDKVTSQAIAGWFTEQQDLTVLAISHDHIWQEVFQRHWYFEDQRILEEERS